MTLATRLFLAGSGKRGTHRHSLLKCMYPLKWAGPKTTARPMRLVCKRLPSTLHEQPLVHVTDAFAHDRIHGHLFETTAAVENLDALFSHDGACRTSVQLEGEAKDAVTYTVPVTVNDVLLENQEFSVGFDFAQPLVRLAVYGTMKQGFPNHWLLDRGGATFERHCATLLAAQIHVTEARCSPVLTMGGGGGQDEVNQIVLVEVYRVPLSLLLALDEKEQHLRRTTISLKSGPAICYVNPLRDDASAHQRMTPVADNVYTQDHARLYVPR